MRYRMIGDKLIIEDDDFPPSMPAKTLTQAFCKACDKPVEMPHACPKKGTVAAPLPPIKRVTVGI